jgi:hypothetical protein
MMSLEDQSAWRDYAVKVLQWRDAKGLSIGCALFTYAPNHILLKF